MRTSILDARCCLACQQLSCSHRNSEFSAKPKCFECLYYHTEAIPFPDVDVGKCVDAILNPATFARTKLSTTERARALCKASQAIAHGQKWSADRPPRSIPSGWPWYMVIICLLSKGYHLVVLRQDAEFEDDSVEELPRLLANIEHIPSRHIPL